MRFSECLLFIQIHGVNDAPSSQRYWTGDSCGWSTSHIHWCRNRNLAM